ncbi:MAG TPA: hypothetical protein PK760_03230, partial [Flavobacteriales bacterium]|nr:hypothetical protein [Flavobacteriales bacterium]
RALFSMMVANGFLLALVPLWCLHLGVLFFFVVRERSQLLTWILFGVVPLIGAAGIGVVLSRLGMLYHGSTSSFMHVTIGTVAWRMFGIESSWLEWTTLTIALVAISVALWSALRSRGFRSPSFIIATLLLGECVGRAIMAKLFHINYAEDRAALHDLVLLILLVALVADEVAPRFRWSWLAALLLLALPLRTLFTLNLDHTVLWPEQSIPDRFIHRIAALEQELGRPAVVGMHRHAGHPYALQRRMLGGEGDGSAHSWPLGWDDARIVTGALLDEASVGYALVDSAPGNQLVLLVRDPRPKEFVVSDTAFDLLGISTVRSKSLWVDAHGRENILLELSGTLAAKEHLDLRVDIVARDTSNVITHMEYVFLSTRRTRWQGETWHTIRHVPSRGNLASVEVFFWAPDSTNYDLKNGRAIMRTSRQ